MCEILAFAVFFHITFKESFEFRVLIAAGGSGLVATLKINISHHREREAEKNTVCVRYRER